MLVTEGCACAGMGGDRERPDLFGARDPLLRGGFAKRSRAEQSAEVAGALTAAGIDFGALTPREQRYYMRSPGQVPVLAQQRAYMQAPSKRCHHHSSCMRLPCPVLPLLPRPFCMTVRH